MAGETTEDAVWLDVLPSMKDFASSLAGEADSAAAAAGSSAGKKFGLALAAGVAVVGAGAVAAGKGLYNIGATFDDVTDTIRVGTGATGDALDGLVQSARNVGSRVPAEFGEVGTTLADLNTRLGLTGPELENLTAQFLEAGRITGEALDTQKVTGALSAFEIKGADASTALDHLYQVSQATGIGMNDLASQVASNAPAVQALGFGFEESAAMVGAFDKAGLNSSRMMAGMSKGLVTLAKDGEEPEAAFKRIVGEIGSMSAAGDKAGAVNLASKVFGTRNASAFVGAIDSGTLALDDLTGSIGATNDTILGAGQDTADFAEQWVIFKNQAMLALEPVAARVFGLLGEGMAWINSTGIPTVQRWAGQWQSGTGQIGAAGNRFRGIIGTVVSAASTAAGVVSSVVDGLGGWSNTLTTLASVIAPVAAGWGLMAAKAAVLAGPVGGLIAKFGPLISRFGASRVALAGLARALTFLTGPVGIAVGAVMLLAPALLHAWRTNETFRSGVITAFSAVRTAITTALGWITGTALPALGRAFVWAGGQVMGMWRAAQPALAAFRAGVSTALTVILTQVLPPLGAAFMAAGRTVQGLARAVAPVVAAVATRLVPVLRTAASVLTSVLGGAFRLAGAIVMGFVRTLGGIFQVARGVVTGDWSRAWSGLKQIASAGRAVLLAGVRLLWRVVTGAFRLGGAAVKAAFGLLWSALKAAGSAGRAALTAGVTALWSSVKGAFTAGKDAVKAAWSGMWSSAKSVGAGAWSSLKSGAAGGWKAITGQFEAGKAAVGRKWSSMWSSTKNASSTGWTSVKNAASSGKTAVVASVEGLRSSTTQKFGAVKSAGTRLMRQLWSVVVRNAGDQGRAVIAKVLHLRDEVTAKFQELKTSATRKAAELWREVKTAFDGGVGGVLELVGTIPGKIVSAMGDMGNLLVQAGKDVAGGLARGIRDGIGGVVSAAGDMSGGAYNEVLTRLGIRSPSRVMMDAGGHVGGGFIRGINSQVRATARSATSMANAVIQSTKALPATLGRTSAQASTRWVNTLTAAVSRSRNAAAAINRSTISAVATAPSQVSRIGTQAGVGYVRGIRSQHGAAAAAARTLAAISSQAAARTLQVRSPSRVYYGLGVQAGAGYVRGIRAQIGPARKAAAELVAIQRRASAAASKPGKKSWSRTGRIRKVKGGVMTAGGRFISQADYNKTTSSANLASFMTWTKAQIAREIASGQIVYGSVPDHVWKDLMRKGWGARNDARQGNMGGEIIYDPRVSGENKTKAYQDRMAAAVDRLAKQPVVIKVGERELARATRDVNRRYQ